MAIKLIKLKSGEDIITNIEEMVIEDKTVGYFLTKPCSIKLKEYNDESGERKGYKIQLFTWVPLSKDEVIPIPLDWTITIVTPVEELLEMYTKDVLKKS
jgi:hypothetical protein